jgi:hypothetical protein
MPPLPPPPPPPLPGRPLVLPRIPTTPASTELSFSDVCFHLRHAGTQVEALINGPQGQSVSDNLPSAYPMAASLKGMKCVRLRKVYNAPADMGRLALRPSPADNSFVPAGIQRLPQPVDGPVTIGEKRKREVDVQSIKRRLTGPLPCLADSSFQSTNMSFSSQSRFQSQSLPEAGHSKPPGSYIPV